jgi:hypothetical protein
VLATKLRRRAGGDGRNGNLAHLDVDQTRKKSSNEDIIPAHSCPGDEGKRSL